MTTDFQKSIAKTRGQISEANRLARVMLRHVKEDRADALRNLELFLDTLVAETGIELTEENLPTIQVFVEQYARDHARAKALREEARADAEAFGLCCRTLPVAAHAVAEGRSPALRFGQHLVVMRAVEADRGSAHQHGRLVREPLDQAHDIAGHAQTRCENLVALGSGP